MPSTFQVNAMQFPQNKSAEILVGLLTLLTRNPLMELECIKPTEDCKMLLSISKHSTQKI